MASGSRAGAMHPKEALDDFTNVMRKSGQAFKVE
jgi:hypothetical protein